MAHNNLRFSSIAAQSAESKVLIRSFTQSDIMDALELWLMIAGQATVGSYGVENIDHFLQQNSGFSGVACMRDNSIVGTILCGHNGLTGTIYHLVVANSISSKDIERALLKFCLMRLTKAGIQRCNFSIYNPNAITH